VHRTSVQRDRIPKFRVPASASAIVAGIWLQSVIDGSRSLALVESKV
jgi:hypothetical protein